MTTKIIDVMQRLTVSEQQVLNAIYSGALPNPNEYEEWDDDHIEPFLNNWQDKIARRKKE